MKNALLTLCLCIIAAWSAAAQTCNPNFVYTTTDGLNYQFYAQPDSNVLAGTPISYNWTFNPSAEVSTAASPTVGFNAVGTYQVCLTIATNVGCVGSHCEEIEVAPFATCDASFTATFDGTTFVANANASDMDSYQWILLSGEGTTYLDADPNLVYALPEPIAGDIFLILNATSPAQSCSESQYFNGTDTTGTGGCNASFDPQYIGGNAVAFSNYSSGGDPATTSFLWTFGDGTATSEAQPLHTFAAAGNYEVCLTINVAGAPGAVGCTDTYCQTVSVGGGGNPCNVPFSITNMGDGVVVFTPASAPSDVVGWIWDFGDGNTLNNAGVVTYQYNASGYYAPCLTVLFADGCTSQVCDSVYVSTGGGLLETSLCGAIYPADADSSSWVNLGGATVYLIQHDIAAGTLTAIAEQNVYNNPGAVGLNYCFDGLPIDGNTYLVKAALLPDSPFYANLLPTYSISSMTWAAATPVILGDFAPNYANLQLIAGDNPGGMGFIGGYISDGAGKTESTALAGVQLILYNAAHAPVAVTYTDTNGNYSFNNLAYGTYYIAVEQLNYTTDETMVILTAANSIAQGNNFIDTGTQFEAVVSGLAPNLAATNGIRLLPNVVSSGATLTVQATKQSLQHISLYDLSGKMVLSQAANGYTAPIATQNLVSGMYLCHITDSKGKLSVAKLLVQ